MPDRPCTTSKHLTYPAEPSRARPAFGPTLGPAQPSQRPTLPPLSARRLAQAALGGAGRSQAGRTADTRIHQISSLDLGYLEVCPWAYLGIALGVTLGRHMPTVYLTALTYGRPRPTTLLDG